MQSPIVASLSMRSPVVTIGKVITPIDNNKISLFPAQLRQRIRDVHLRTNAAAAVLHLGVEALHRRYIPTARDNHAGRDSTLDRAQRDRDQLFGAGIEPGVG